MGIKIKFRNDILLDCSNAVFCGFYNSMTEFIEKNNIILNENVKEFIESLEAGCRGIGLDIINYLNSKNDILSFLELIRKTLNEVYKKMPDFAYKSLFEQFYNELLNASAKLHN